MGGSGQPLEVFGKGFKGKPGNLEMAGPDSTQLWWLRGDTTQKRENLGNCPRAGWDEALPQRSGGFKALGVGLGGRVLPRSHGAATGEEGPTSLGSPPGHPLGPAAALTVFGLFSGLNFNFNVHFSFQFHISVSI